ncbi:MAG: NAD(P)H-hydrate dehydratase [Actinomycetia bacterium]|nr:NAD(P)H-hydrate dehydratase [Actinomycetes bacterium]
MSKTPDESAPGTAKNPRLITPAMLRAWPLPDPVGSKYSRGQVLVVGGARGTPGAVALAGLSALRMGAGRLTLAVAESVSMSLAVSIPESGVIGLPESSTGSVTGEDVERLLGRDLERADAVLVGPGLDDPEGTGRILEDLVPVAPKSLPIVLDAYGATVLPDLSKECLDLLSGRVVLSPNEVEIAHLLEVDEVGPDELATATRKVVDRYGAVIACAGWVVTPDGFWRVATGDTGLGTSGSGDVLAGGIAGLLSRGAPSDQALVWGAYVHAAAGDRLASHFGRIGYLASELLPELPQVLASFRGD